MKSGLDLRPNAPPSNVTWTVTFAASTLRYPAIVLRASAGDCVGAQASTLPSCTRAIAASGSICACDRYGTWYSALSLRSAAARAAAASPLVRPGLPGERTLASSAVLYDFESCDSLGPASQVILSASRPRSAAQVFCAITATPPSGKKAPGIGVSGMRTMRSTPGTLRASLSSTLTTLPPQTGGRAMTATFMPGSVTSAPYTAVPVVIGTRSIDGIFLPCHRRSSGRLMRTLAGAGIAIVRAVATSSPNGFVRPVGRCTTSCWRAKTSATSTFHWLAAAASSSARVVAPASRYLCRKSRMLVDPSVFCEPYLGSPTACSTRHLAQSASISSAMIIGIVVRMPWPISER